MATDKLIHPDGGAKIDTAGRPVTKEPIPGGVMIVNASVRPDHDAHVVYREQTTAEKRLHRETTKAQAAFNRADAMLFVRMTRDEMLRATDHYEMNPALAGSKAKSSAWLKWRQALRDFPAKVKDPEDVTWPAPPEVTSVLLPWRRYWPKLSWSKYGG